MLLGADAGAGCGGHHEFARHGGARRGDSHREILVAWRGLLAGGRRRGRGPGRGGDLHPRAVAGSQQLVIRFRGRHEGAEEAVRLVVDSGGKEQGPGWARPVAVAEPDAPQPVDRDGRPVCVLQRAFEVTRVNFVCVDGAVSEVADQEISAEVTEARRREGEAPGRVERAATDQSLHQLAFVAEHVDEAAVGTLEVVLPHVVLNCVADIYPVADGLDAERTATSWDLAVLDSILHVTWLEIGVV